MTNDALNNASVIHVQPLPALALMSAAQIVAIIRRSERQASAK